LTFFAITVPEYEAKCVQLGCFSRGVDLFALKFYLWQGRPPATILGVRKLDTLGYPMVKTASLCVSSFWHNTGVWRTDGFAVAHTSAFGEKIRLTGDHN